MLASDMMNTMEGEEDSGVQEEQSSQADTADTAPSTNETQEKVRRVDVLKGKLATVLHTAKRYKYHLAGALVFLLVLVVVGALTQTDERDPLWLTYGGSYRLVPDAISQSAAIAISVPDEAGEVSAEQVYFTPELEGEFVLSEEEQVLLYQPRELPKIGSYYNVALSYGSTTIGADFKVVEDPKVVSILPTAEAETHEETKISVIFSRPMVPLSAREEMDKELVPVQLEPSVDGTWKWKSTRLLQFIPAEDLDRSTKYTVTVHEGFRSLDGVAVQGFSHTFTTRTLKHDTLPSRVRYDAPLEIRFNQPVDLERTAQEVMLTRDGKEIEAIIQYAEKESEERGFLGLVLFGKDAEVDNTKLWIRPMQDMHGREGLWDFETSYRLTIPKRYPLEGTVDDTSPLVWSYRLPAVLSNLSAESERSGYVEPMFFDTQGELIATFAEPVDVRRTQVSMPGLRDVKYAMQCKRDDDGNTIYKEDSKECEEEANIRSLRIRVDRTAYKPDEQVELVFEKVVSPEGLLLNLAPITWQVRTVPELQILRTVPENGTTTASLTRLVLCTNTPLTRPESVRDSMSISGYVVYPNSAWSSSYKVRNSYSTCAMGQYETKINYGLHPEKDYTISSTLTDPFESQAELYLSVRTEPAPSEYTRIHSLQKWYNVTVPGKTRLTYALENLPDVTVHMCKMAPDTFLHTLEERGLDGIPNAQSCTEVHTHVVDVPDDYWVNNYFHFDVADHFNDVRGHYVITFTHPNYRTSQGQQMYEHTLLTVSNLTVGEKLITTYGNYDSNESEERTAEMSPHNLYWVLNANTLDPIFGATVQAFLETKDSNKEKQVVAGTSGSTNRDGVARLAAEKDVAGATVTFGGDTAVVSTYTDTLQRRWGRGVYSATYLYTDRPIYRPGDEVHIRGIDRIGYDHDWEVTEGYEADVSVTSSRGDVLSTQTVTMSPYGTFDLSVTLPDDASLGRYRISTLGASGWFDVEEYVGAPFKVEVVPDELEYVAGETAEVTINADYYFDMPVASGEVQYTVLAQDYHFDRYTDEYFNFGGGWYSCYWCGYGDTFISRNTIELDSGGDATISIPLDYKEHFGDPDEEGSKLFTVIARVQDESGREVSAQGSIIVHRGAYYLGVKTDRYVAGKGTSIPVRVKSVDTDGKPMALSGITLTATHVEWESYRRREVDGGFYWHSEEKRTVVDTRTIRTDASGNASSAFVFDEPGSYEIGVTRTDTLGNVIRGVTRVYVWGDGHVAVRSTNNETLTVTTDKPSYQSGETVTVLVESPYSKGRALITTERGDVYQYWTQAVNAALFTQDIPLPKEYAPSVYASVLLVGPGPEVKYGNAELRVDTEQYELSVDVTPSKSHYLPGEEVELRVRTARPDGSPVAADVSIAVVDLSVLALVGNPKKDPVSFFYGSLPLAVSTSHSAKNMLIEQDIPTGTKGGGGAAEDLERRKRGVFKDTAYWEASVVTDASGEGTVHFVLPDNLTTWQIEALGVTEDTVVGVDYTEFISKKRLMVTPLRPRFVVPGDSMWLGMQIANNTERDIRVRAHIESDTLEVVDTEEKTVRVRAGEQAVVYFGTNVPRGRTDGTHVVTFFAEHDEFEDVVEQSIAILEDKTYEVTATAGMTTEPFVFESVYIPDYALEDGELTVRAQPTLVAAMLDAVEEMAGYPYGCSEQIASKLAALTTVRRVGDLFGEAAIEEVQEIVFDERTYSVDGAMDAGLKDLLSRQTHDGGFSFYTGTGPSLYLTVEVLSALTVIRNAGYHIPDSIFERAAEYVTKEFAQSMYYTTDNDMVARIAYALSSPYVPVAERKKIESRVRQIEEKKLQLERLSTTGLGYLTLATQEKPYSNAIAKSFYTALQSRLVIDARGAYVESNRQGGYSWFESPEKNTALLLQAIAAYGGEHPALDNMLRWLLVSKRSTGDWGSTNATFTVLNAALLLAEARGENAATYLLTLFRDDESVATHEVNENTLFDTFEHTFPLTTFGREQLHDIALRKEETDEARGTLYYDMQLRYALPPDMVPPRDEGITVTRTLSLHGAEDAIDEAQVGDLVTGTIEIVIPEVAHAVSIESFIPAGFEIVNFSFATEGSRDLAYADDGTQREEYPSSWWWGPPSGPRAWPVTYQEFHDDRVFVFTEQVQPGVYVYEYTLRALVPGTFHHMPATVYEMYAPEVFGRTNGSTFTITEG